MQTYLLLIDSHVHIHECFDLEEFLNNIFANFSNYAHEIDNSIPWIGVLLLSEIKGNNFFNLILNSSGQKFLNNFIITKTEEEESFIIQKSNGQKVIVISGRQIITKGGIELLTLCTTKYFNENEDLHRTILDVITANAIPVIPWGVGKWVGEKKNIVRDFINLNKNINFFLGDNSGRIKFWPEPYLFKLGKSCNRFILPGTDALPIRSEVSKTGSYGFYLITKMDFSKPSESLKKNLNELDKSPSTFGKLENPVKFFRNQFIMQINKYKNKQA
jgi:hypothetical protein